MANRSRGRRTDYEWTGACGDADAIDLAVNVTTAPLVFVDFNAPFTIMRIRGIIQVQLNAAAVNERALIAFGIGIVTTDARAAGTVPDPAQEPEFPWMWYGYAAVSSLNEAAIQPDALSAILEVDTKAMRKVKPGQSVMLVGQVCSSQDQGGSFDVQAGLRFLLGS